MELIVKDYAGPVTCIQLVGRLDAPGADQIGLQFTAASAAKGRATVVDLSKVNFVASMGLRLLIASAKSLKQKGATLVLFGANEMVQSVLEDAALDQIIPVYATEAEALAAAIM